MTTLLVGSVVIIVSSVTVYAQDVRSYFYQDITQNIQVHTNASIHVDEIQTYDFTGEYHLGYRSILHKDIGAITNITVTDQLTGEAYTYSYSKLDKANPYSWGKYTTYEQNGSTIIEWYYDLGSNPHNIHAWKLSYTVHGAVGFYSDHDQLYWNMFTDYNVPISNVQAHIELPQTIISQSQSFYTTKSHVSSVYGLEGRTFYFSSTHIFPHESVTIAAGWQKGMILQQAYWKDWVQLYTWYLISLGVILASIFIGIVYWFFAEKYKKGRGTIIPEYSPPQNLTPAMAQLIATERINDSTWPATIVDLAVRGYIKIINEQRENTALFTFMRNWLPLKGYRIEKVKEYTTDTQMYEYEKTFLDLLFKDTPGIFSTIDFAKKINSQILGASEFRKQIVEIVKILYKETSDDTHAYIVPLTAKDWTLKLGWLNNRLVWQIGLLFLLFPLIIANENLLLPQTQYTVLGLSVIISLIGLYISIKLNPRLNAQGFLLRDDWRGFKLYLEKAEQYRLQNLTPETFEKYLPYAMIFGIEKQWAKNFDSMNMQVPLWYGTTGYVTGSNGGMSDEAFSASVFSSSFSLSFTSAFASSGVSGASGGGGGAGAS